MVLVSTAPLRAQQLLYDALVNGCRVFIYSQEGIKRDLVDRFAEEVANGAVRARGRAWPRASHTQF